MADPATKTRRSLANAFKDALKWEMIARGVPVMSLDERNAHAYALAGDSMRSWYPFRHGDSCRCVCGFEGHFDSSPVGSVVIEDAVWREGDGWRCVGCC